MDGITLLREAWGAGLTVRADGDRVVIRGPQKAEALAKRLLENKAKVLDALRTNGLYDAASEPTPDIPGAPATGSALGLEPDGSCPASGIAGADVIDQWLAGQDFSGWRRRPECQGRWGWEPPDLPEADRWWEEYDFGELPEADWTCPQCGGLLWWEDLLGGKHCLLCEADKAERADRLAAKTARLRLLNPPPTEAGPAASEHVGEPSGSPIEPPAWPGALADWTMLLTPDDLPERFHLRQGVEVVDSAKFLASLRRDIRRGPSGPRARYGGLQSDLVNLHSALLGGQATAPGDRPPRTAHVARKLGWPTRNASDATALSEAARGLPADVKLGKDDGRAAASGGGQKTAT